MRKPRYALLRDSLSAAAKTPLSWPSIPSFLPHRLRRKFRSSRSRLRSRTAPASSITALKTSFSLADTLHALRTHQWSFWDGQYFLLTILGILSLSIIQSPGPFTKTLIAALLCTSLIIPVTRQFFLPLLPIVSWLVFFYAMKFIGAEYRPPIWVRVLPALENIFYGANLSNILSAHKATALDVLAWLPYGLTHFGAPVVVSALLFVFGPPGTLPVFARTFGYMNLFGVIIQFLLPCSPPWYENLYGLAPANYGIPGSPAGLAAIDKLFGVDMYTSTFTASPVVFGAFPSLHAGCATTEALFMVHAFPRLTPLFVLYVLWLCWATMYLSHHYAVDLVAGALLASVCFLFARSKFLPRPQPDKFLRWDYDYTESGEARDHAHAYNELPFADNGDDWDLGSYSQASTGSSLGERSPSGSVGLRSPVDVGVDKEGDSWEGETLASGSDVEKR